MPNNYDDNLFGPINPLGGPTAAPPYGNNNYDDGLFDQNNPLGGLIAMPSDGNHDMLDQVSPATYQPTPAEDPLQAYVDAPLGLLEVMPIIIFFFT